MYGTAARRALPNLVFNIQNTGKTLLQEALLAISNKSFSLRTYLRLFHATSSGPTPSVDAYLGIQAECPASRDSSVPLLE